MKSELLGSLIEYLQIEREKISICEYNFPKSDWDHHKLYSNWSGASAKRQEWDQPGHLMRGYEFGLASDVGDDYFIFQLDAKTQDLAKLVEFVDQRGSDYRIYDSGDSYHVYFRKLVEKKTYEFKSFLAGVVVKDREGLIDHRWIAHSIVDSRSNLRFTNNTGVKKKIPELVVDKRF